MKPAWVVSLALSLITSVTLGKPLYFPSLQFPHLYSEGNNIEMKLRPYGGLLGTNSFHVPHFLFVGNRLHSAFLTFPEFHKAASNKCLSGKGEDAETKEEQSRNNSAAMGQGPDSSSRNIHNNFFELFHRN